MQYMKEGFISVVKWRGFEGVSKIFQKELPPLTAREKEILELIAEGYTNPQIAEKIF